MPGIDPAVALLDQALDRPALVGSTRLICVDGPAGSGKSTLAAAILDACEDRGRTGDVMHLDDMYDGWETDFDELAARVVCQVLVPMRRGEPASWQRYDWYAERFGAWVETPSADVLVVEGCGSGARVIASYSSLLVWVETSRGERVRRGVARDGEQVLPRWLAWMEREAEHFAKHRTRERADVRIET